MATDLIQIDQDHPLPEAIERAAAHLRRGDIVAIPRDVTVNILGADEEWSGRQAVVRFLPDGASSGTVLILSREQAAYEIRVNWYTGGVAIEAR